MQKSQKSSSDTFNGDASLQKIPSSFYDHVLEMISSLPAEQMQWSACNVIFQHALEALDPRQDNVAVFITQCVPPLNSNKVRSLRQIMGAGVAPWGGKVEGYASSFLGANTVPGQVVSLAHAITVQNYQEPREEGYESQSGIVSSCTYPLMRTGLIMGTFGATSILPEYFTPPRQALIQEYAHLVSILFPPDVFYAQRNIGLRIMPPAVVQLPHTAIIRRRIAQILSENTHRNVTLTNAQAERLAWQHLEEEMLQLVTPH